MPPRWLLLLNSEPIVYFFHYVAVFAELRRFHGSHLPIEMNWWDWCNKNCGAKKKSRGSFFCFAYFLFFRKIWKIIIEQCAPALVVRLFFASATSDWKLFVHEAMGTITKLKYGEERRTYTWGCRLDWWGAVRWPDTLWGGSQYLLERLDGICYQEKVNT